MNCERFLEQVEALALDALEPEERRECEDHLREPVRHLGCEAALDGARAVAAKLVLVLPPVEPHPRVWAAIEAELGVTSLTEARDKARRRSSGGWPAWLGWAAAAALLLVLLLVERRGARGRAELAQQLAEARQQAAAEQQVLARASADSDDRHRQCEREVARLREDLAGRREAVALLELPATRVVPLAAQAGSAGHATALVNLEQRRAVLLARGLPAAAGDYELWVIRGDRKQPAGLLRQGAEGGVAVLDPALLEGGVDAIAITLEPQGGRPAPTGPILFVAAVPARRG